MIIQAGMDYHDGLKAQEPGRKKFASPGARQDYLTKKRQAVINGEEAGRWLGSKAFEALALLLDHDAKSLRNQLKTVRPNKCLLEDL